MVGGGVEVFWEKSFYEIDVWNECLKVNIFLLGW